MPRCGRLRHLRGGSCGAGGCSAVDVQLGESERCRWGRLPAAAERRSQLQQCRQRILQQPPAKE